MRFHFHLGDNTKHRLGDLAVMCVLAIALIASYGCGPDAPAREVASAENEVDLYTYKTVARVETVPAPAEMRPAPAPVVVTYETAEAAYKDGRFLDALELFEGYVEQKPENPWGFYMLGLSARMAGETLSSIVAFERALELDPRHLKSHLNLARVLIGDGQLERAGQYVDAALGLDPESGEAYRLLGRLCSESGDLEGAIHAFGHALVIDEWDTWSMNNLGVLFIGEGEFDRAVLPLARATELRGDVAVFQNNLGMALERLGYFVEAAQAYGAAVAADPGHTRASSNFGRIDGRVNRSYLEPLDLKQLARDFSSEIVSWRTNLADVPLVEVLSVPDVADSTPPPVVVPDTNAIKPDSVRVW